MTAATLTHLPLAAGGAVLASAGRAVAWTFSRYMRAPLANTAVIAMVSMSAMAASNALYLQQQAHPAPLFATPVKQVAASAPVVVPVTPAMRKARPQRVAPLPQSDTTGSVQRDPEAVIGNAEVFELQRKLTMMELFDGEVDGYYGPQTAGAIRKFEERMGLIPKGELSEQIIEAVRAAPAFSTGPRVQPLRAPAPQAEAPKVTAIVPSSVEPLPVPEPLPVAVQTTAAVAPASTQQGKPLRREIPETPQAALNLAVDTAGDAIDTIINGVQTVTMNRPAVDQPAVSSNRASQSAAAATPPAASTPVTQVAMLEPTAPTPSPVVASNDSAAAPAEVPILDTEARPEDLMPPFSVTDPAIVSSVQRGLASLGFLHGPADGVAGEATAKAIRNFEVYFNYKVTGRISPELLDLLVRNGASI